VIALSRKEFSFKNLKSADLQVDALYEAGISGNLGDDPISKLMGCGNQGGFRIVGNSKARARIRVGYNSHGAWSTIEEIRCEEVERGNYFPKLDYPPGTPAMWICLTPRKALRYVALAERWDHLDDETQPLTCEEEEMLESIVEIPLKPTDIIVHDDGDEGYLVLRPTKGKH